MASARNGIVKNIEVFVKNNPEYWKYVDDSGATLTHKAASKGRLEAVKFLVGKDRFGKSLAIKDQDGRRPLDAARWHKKQEVVEYLESIYTQRGIPLSRDLTATDRFNQAMAAVRDGDLETVEKFMKDYPNFLDFKDTYDGSTLVHKAAGYGQETILKELLGRDRKGIPSLSVKTKDGKTPLDFARDFGHDKVVDLLEILVLVERWAVQREPQSQQSSSSASTSTKYGNYSEKR